MISRANEEQAVDCGRPPQSVPAPCKLTFDLLTDLESGVRVTCDVGYLYGNLPVCVLSCLSCLLLHPVLLCFLSSVCMLYVYGCFGEINYDRPLCSRLRPDVRDRRQTSDAHHRSMPPTLGAGHNNRTHRISSRNQCIYFRELTAKCVQQYRMSFNPLKHSNAIFIYLFYNRHR